jgi:dihydrofolate synthase/folylpolyglutamate synthase
MDHEAYLGHTLTEIAGEKAGIIKAGVPVVSGAIHPEVMPVIERVSRERHAPLYTLRQEFDYASDPDGSWTWRGGEPFGNRRIAGLRTCRASLVQQENDSLAIAGLQALENKGFPVNEPVLRAGLAEVRWPGRMEYFEQAYPPPTAQSPGGGKGAKKLRYLLDGAHNPDGVKNLVHTLTGNFSYQRLIVVWGSMSDKDLALTLGAMAPLVDELILTRPHGERAARPEQLLAYLGEAERGKTRCVAEVPKALIAAQDGAAEGDLIVVGGSLYLIGEVRHLLLGDLL